jgi:predicted transcriptional regulator
MRNPAHPIRFSHKQVKDNIVDYIFKIKCFVSPHKAKIEEIRYSADTTVEDPNHIALNKLRKPTIEE